jgi:hypothetical protein
MNELPCCDRCGELIGVYEPLITLDKGRAHETSRAAEPPPGGRQASACYHRACYGHRHGDDPTPRWTAR